MQAQLPLVGLDPSRLRRPIKMMTGAPRTRRRSRRFSICARLNVAMSWSRRPWDNSDSRWWTTRAETGTFIGVMLLVLRLSSWPNYSLIKESITIQGCINSRGKITWARIWWGCIRFSLWSTTFSLRHGYCLKRWMTSDRNLIKRRIIRHLLWNQFIFARGRAFSWSDVLKIWTWNKVTNMWPNDTCTSHTS